MSTQAQPTQAALPPASARGPFFRRVWIALIVLVILLLLALVPPYLNVNRLQRRITASISASLGRPVHLDNVTLTLLPFPGFTLDHFVVSEDPAFGYEPTIRANTVTVRIRLSTLWRRRIEISRITFTDPSVNLVHTAEGKWNLNSILLQASQISTAPTAQRTAGPAPRFPYIEATGARLNLKIGQVKTPFSLTDADFSLWLPSPETWHFRITARPVRTDIPTGYAGLLHLEGTLGRAPTLTRIPIDLRGEWRAAPLGEVSRILLGSDAGWRGEMTLNASTRGTIGANDLLTTLHLTGLHRTDFVPPHPLAVSAACTASFTSAFTSIPAIDCAIPALAKQPAFTLTAAVPDTHTPAPAAIHATLAPIPAAALVPLLQTFSLRIPPTLILGGTFSGDLDCDAAPCDPAHLEAGLNFENGTIVSSSPDPTAPILLGDISLHTPPPVANPPKAASRQRPRRKSPNIPVRTDNSFALLLPPTTIALGGREPALLEARIDLHGLTLHLTGAATPSHLAALAQAVPQFADDLPEAFLHPPKPSNPTQPDPPLRLDLTASRPWIGPQSWQENTLRLPPVPHTSTKTAR